MCASPFSKLCVRIYIPVGINLFHCETKNLIAKVLYLVLRNLEFLGGPPYKISTELPWSTSVFIMTTFFISIEMTIG